MAGKCAICGAEGKEISAELQVCLRCIRQKPEEALALAQEAHATSRRRFGFPAKVPRGGKVKCTLCVNQCELHEGERSLCGLRVNRGGKLVHLSGTAREAVVSAYHDALPTNCVAAWVCAGCTGAGYPRYSHAEHGVELGYKNLAVFYGACTFDCLFCQNWEYRENARTLSPRMTPEQLASLADSKTSCICYFGGDPSPQIAHSIKTSELALSHGEGEILRICYETNGSMHPGALRKAAKLSLESGGCIKFDLKAWDDNLHLVLTGASNRYTIENFAYLASLVEERPSPPFLIASTLLVPGYIDEAEVEAIARFIAELNPEIPYSLLAFYPTYMMRDLPTTSWKQARACLEAARRYLRNVKLGNVHLLR
jgi:pyruvate formate lyase activating enzyme